jgi:hypothetical protein
MTNPANIKRSAVVVLAAAAVAVVPVAGGLGTALDHPSSSAPHTLFGSPGGRAGSAYLAGSKPSAAGGQNLQLAGRKPGVSPGIGV